MVQDEEVAQQLLNSAAGTTRKYVRGQNVVLNAARDTTEVFDTSKLTPSQLQQIAQQMATMNIGVEKKPLTATQRWKALQAAKTDTETDLPESSTYSSDDELPPATAPIRVPRRQATAPRRRR